MIQLNDLIEGIRVKIDAYWTACGYKHGRPNVDFELGRRYVRIVKSDNEGSHRSVWGFVDKTNGDVLKAASWKAPAKHARGNIFDLDKALANCDWTGPNYLR